jgi:hypothetical protein
MKENLTRFDAYALECLKIKLCDVVHFIVASKPDCAKLSELIAKSGVGYVSESTLYRLFFQPEHHAPYKNTLDILAKFIGFKDSVSFLDDVHSKKETMAYMGLNPNTTKSSLLFHAIKHDATNTLKDFFESMYDCEESTKEIVGIAVYDSLKLMDKPEKFLKKFAAYNFIREYFFEKAHDPKFRIKNYDESYQYYLAHVKKDRSIAELQSFIFGNCVLFRHLYLTKNLAQAIQIGSNLYQDEMNIDDLRNQLYTFPYVRYISYKLWYLQLCQTRKNKLTEYAEYLMARCQELKESLAHTEQRIMFHTIAEVFSYSHIPESFHTKLKALYASEFERIPSGIYAKHLKHSLPYFDENGLLHHRP